MTTQGVAVAFDNVVKAFGPVQVLHGVSFDLAPGRVYGLLGENGAGKSTLMKILAGYEALTSGELRVNGQPQQFRSSREAEALGIVLIHQEFNLAEDLSVADNIFLGHEKRKGLFLDDRAMRAEAAAALAQVGLVVDPATKVRRLIVAEKQLVALSMLNVEVSRALGSRRFDELARRFDEIVYGGRPALEDDVRISRVEWAELLNSRDSR